MSNEKIRRKKRKKDVEIKAKPNCCSSSSDDSKGSPYDTDLLKAAIRRTDIKKTPEKLNNNEPVTILESSEDIESNILELRLQALQSTELLKKDVEIKKPEIDDKEEQELRCIALKSAVVKKHEARLRKKLELRPYSPTDVIVEKIEIPFISPILSPALLNDENEKMDISPDISSADCVPVDMIFSSERSNSPTYFTDKINNGIVKKNNFTEILTGDDKSDEIVKEPSQSEKKINEPLTDFSLLEEDCLRSLLLSNLKKKKTKDVKESPDSPNFTRSETETPPEKVLELKEVYIEIPEEKTLLSSVVKLPTSKITEVPVKTLKIYEFPVKPQLTTEIVKPVAIKPKKVEISPIYSPAETAKPTTIKKLILKPKVVKPILKKTINVLTPAKINQSIKALTVDIPRMKKIQNATIKSPLSTNLQSKKVSPMIIRLGVSSESEDEFYAQHNIENNKPALMIGKSDVPEKCVVNVNSDVPVSAAPPEFEKKLDQFLKNARSKLEKKTVTFPKENTTPMVSRFLIDVLWFFFCFLFYLF